MSTELVLQVVQELKHMLLLEITTLNNQECVCLINNRRSHSVKRSIGPLKGAESLRTGFRGKDVEAFKPLEITENDRPASVGDT